MTFCIPWNFRIILFFFSFFGCWQLNSYFTNIMTIFLEEKQKEGLCSDLISHNKQRIGMWQSDLRQSTPSRKKKKRKKPQRIAIRVSSYRKKWKTRRQIFVSLTRNSSVVLGGVRTKRGEWLGTISIKQIQVPGEGKENEKFTLNIAQWLVQKFATSLKVIINKWTRSSCTPFGMTAIENVLHPWTIHWTCLTGTSS